MQHKSQIRWRLLNGTAYHREYRRTKQGLLANKYSQMSKRVRGKDNRGKYYLGLPIVARHDFYCWALGCYEFHRLFENYKKSDWLLRLAPTINRIDSYKGYTFDNMEWVTFSENSRLEKKPFLIKTY